MSRRATSPRRRRPPLGREKAGQLRGILRYSRNPMKSVGVFPQRVDDVPEPTAPLVSSRGGLGCIFPSSPLWRGSRGPAIGQHGTGSSRM